MGQMIAFDLYIQVVRVVCNAIVYIWIGRIFLDFLKSINKQIINPTLIGDITI